jgi:hypothetical protein
MSRIRHLVWPKQSDARNSSGDENVRAAKPNSFSKSGSDSRTDSSSSTTDTSERVTIIDFSCRVHRRRLRQRQTRCIRTRVGQEVDVPVRECCPYQSGQRIDDDTVLRCDLFSEGLHNTRVRHSRRHCLLHLSISIGLPIRDEERSADQNATLQSRNPLVSPVTARTRAQIPHAASVTSGVGMARFLPAPVASSGPRGIQNENVAPGPLFSVAHRRPW